ncbi:phage tail assembly chaperone [Ensifer sp. 22564]|uniref:phage tail assembly chaperone n=1 Tax=Ensifer sp. 22564 TaxID=3453943 RepID=UPI003F83CD80
MPEHGTFIWDWFWELRQSQPPGFSGPVPISNLELASWCQLSGNIITREEVWILRAMDTRFCSEIEKESAAIRTRESDV